MRKLAGVKASPAPAGTVRTERLPQLSCSLLECNPRLFREPNSDLQYKTGIPVTYRVKAENLINNKMQGYSEILR